MRVMTKAIFKEMCVVAGITLLGLVVLVLLQQTIRLADLITRQGVAIAAVMRILPLALPALLVIILPVCALMAPVITYSRLASDSELLALRATGYSLYQLLSPVVGVAMLLATATVILIVEVIPHTNFLARKQIFEAVSSSLQLHIRERVFQEPIPGLVLYVEHVDPRDGTLHQVFISDSRTPEVTTIVSATADIAFDFQGMRVVLELRDGSLQRREEKGDVQRAAFERYRFVIEFGSTVDDIGLGKKRVREMTLHEMRREVSALRAAGESYLRPLVEWHKRVALPIACLVLGFVGAPIGSFNRRTGRLGGFALSAATLLLYYLLVTTGGSLAETGAVPPLVGVWAPLVLVAASAFALVLRANGTRLSRLAGILGPQRER
jgi:lipopolysaccharide export system permease protein